MLRHSAHLHAHAIPMAPKLKPKEVVSFYYKPHDTLQHHFVCLCSRVREQKGTGYTNLMDHIKREHKDYEARVIEARLAGADRSVFRSIVVSSKGKKIFQWMETVIGDLQPFSFVEKEYVRKNMQPPPICTETLVKYMLKLTEVVEKKIEKELPDLFALVFDGWSNGSSHMVATFASFPSSDKNGHKQRLISFSTLEDETTQSADEHGKHLDYVLGCYNKS